MCFLEDGQSFDAPKITCFDLLYLVRLCILKVSLLSCPWYTRTLRLPSLRELQEIIAHGVRTYFIPDPLLTATTFNTTSVVP